MKIIALGHRKNTGKDTLAGLLSARLRSYDRGVNLVVVGFADEVKDTCHRLYGWAGIQTREYYEHHPAAKEDYLRALGKTVRQVWIEVGSHMRKLDEDIWVRALLNRPNIDVMIIKDLRLPHELKHVLEMGGHTVKVIRDAAPVVDDGADNLLAYFDGWDVVISNNGSFDDLNHQAGLLLKKLNLGE